MTIYYITGLCEGLFKAFFLFWKAGAELQSFKICGGTFAVRRGLNKKKDMSEHKCEQKILQAFTQVK